MTKQLDEMIRRAGSMAKAAIEAEGHTRSIWIGETADGTLVPVMPAREPNSVDAVARLAATISAVFNQLGVVRYVCVAEAFCLEGAAAQNYRGGDPRENPDARHIVYIHAEDNTGATRGARHYVLRHELGKATLSPAFPSPADETAVCGMLPGLLAPANGPAPGAKLH